MPDRWTHVDHPDDERYDTVTIECIPRWKESELSGDEYRFSYLIKAWRKGEVIVARSFSSLKLALQALQYTIYIWTDNDDAFNREAWDRTKDKCDQPKCYNLATIFYKRLRPYTNRGEELVANDYSNEYRQFCESHKHRGDCGLDDADQNYEKIEDPRIVGG